MNFRNRVGGFLDTSLFQNAILGVILFNAAILGLETVEPLMARAGALIVTLDKLCLSIFVVEIVAKLYARGFAGFFRRGWNVFDFVIVGISLVPTTQGLSVLRALRVLRVLRLVSVVTLESWSMGIVRPVMEQFPYAWAFFVPFIMVTTFAVVNLLVGLIVNSMQDAHHAEDVEKTDTYRDEVLSRLERLEEMMREGQEARARAPAIAAR